MIGDPRGGWTSASAAPFDDLCAGRYVAQKMMGPEPESKDAAFGNKIHNALSRQDPTGLDLDERRIYDDCLRIEEETVKKVYGPNWDLAIKSVRREERFWMQYLDWKHSGQVDVVYIYKGVILVIEYKTLPGQVSSSPSNLQLRDQIVLAVNDILLVTAAYAAVIQPLITQKPELVIYNRQQITESRERMWARIRESHRPGPRTAGTPQCDYCRAKRACPEYQAWAGSKLPVTPSLLTTPVVHWTPDQRAIFCENRLVAQKWLDHCEQEIKDLLAKDRDAVPGWCLAPGDWRETITNPQAVFDRFAQSGGQLDDFMKCLSVTKGKLKSALSEATKLQGKELEVAFELLLAGLVERKQTKPSLEKKK